MIRYKIISNLKLIIECFCGEVTYDDYISYKSLQAKDLEYDPNYNVLVDLRDSILKVSREEINGVVDFVKQNSALMGKRKVAALTHEPEHVVVTTLLYQNRITPIQADTFSTVDASISFLGYSMFDSAGIKGILREMKKEHNNDR